MKNATRTPTSDRTIDMTRLTGNDPNGSVNDEIAPLRLETPVPLRSPPSEGDRPVVAGWPSREMNRRGPTLPRSNCLLHEKHESAITSRDEQGTSTSGIATEKEGGSKLPRNLPL